MTKTIKISKKRRTLLKEALDRYLLSFDAVSRVQNDAVVFPRRYRSRPDQELIGILSALFAFGRVASFSSFLEELFHRLSPSPSKWLKTSSRKEIVGLSTDLRYRWVGKGEISRLLLGLQQCLSDHGTLEGAFRAGDVLSGGEESDYKQALSFLVDQLEPQGRRATFAGEVTKSYRNLLAHPERGSACKRLNLFLRWMIRPDDGVDLGLWKGFPLDRLVVPLDTHVRRVCGHLGLISGTSNRWNTAVSITEALKTIDGDDPVRLDFALCHLGMSGVCPTRVSRDACAVCPLVCACTTGKRITRSRRADSPPGSRAP